MKYIIYISILFINILHSQITDFKNLNFKKADSIANKLKNEELYDLVNLSSQLTQSLESDIEKFRAIYVWVCSNIEIDNSIYERNAKFRNKYKNDSIKLLEWNKKISKETFQNLIYHKKTVCSGYTYLIKELASLANIKCEIINGFGRTSDSNLSINSLPNHSWNAVYLNSKWYLCDATWSSGFYDLNINSFVFDYNDGFFLTDPKEFILNHFPTDIKWSFIEKNIPIEDFLNFPLASSEAFKNKIYPYLPDTFHLVINSTSDISFQFNSKKQIDIAKLSIEIVSRNKKIEHYPKFNINSGIITFNYSIKDKGRYDLHIKYNNVNLISYDIEVKN